MSIEVAQMDAVGRLGVAIKRIEKLKDELQWIIDQRWQEDADLDDICTRAEKALATLEE